MPRHVHIPRSYYPQPRSNPVRRRATTASSYAEKAPDWMDWGDEYYWRRHQQPQKSDDSSVWSKPPLPPTSDDFYFNAPQDIGYNPPRRNSDSTNMFLFPEPPSPGCLQPDSYLHPPSNMNRPPRSSSIGVLPSYSARGFLSAPPSPRFPTGFRDSSTENDMSSVSTNPPQYSEMGHGAPPPYHEVYEPTRKGSQTSSERSPRRSRKSSKEKKDKDEEDTPCFTFW